MTTDTTGRAPASILLLGDPALRKPSEIVRVFDDPTFRRDHDRLQATLEAFRAANGFGRAVSAPQIGVHRRLIAVNLGDGPSAIVNPEIAWASHERITMWDDCMSFPSLLVRVERHASISVRFRDLGGAEHVWERLDTPTAELLQHEIDHLDGVLAVDRAVDREAIVLREVFDTMRDRFLDQVNYVIPMPAYKR